MGVERVVTRPSLGHTPNWKPPCPPLSLNPLLCPSVSPPLLILNPFPSLLKPYRRLSFNCYPSVFILFLTPLFQPPSLPLGFSLIHIHSPLSLKSFATHNFQSFSVTLNFKLLPFHPSVSAPFSSLGYSPPPYPLDLTPFTILQFSSFFYFSNSTLFLVSFNPFPYL